LRPAAAPDLPVVEAWAHAFIADTGLTDDAADMAEDVRRAVRDGRLYVWDDGQPVTMATWTDPTPNGVRVTLVYTPPALRGRGYASSCVAALSALLLASGRRACFLFTDLANPTSNSIYMKIGYRPVCDVHDYRFERAGVARDALRLAPGTPHQVL
jgi:predicted GNAT family acetyltransferase